MKITISGSKDEIKEALKAIAGSPEHLKLVHGFSNVTPKSIQPRMSAKESEKDRDSKEN